MLVISTNIEASKKAVEPRKTNTDDQWSEPERTLQSRAYQQKMGQFFVNWKLDLQHQRTEQAKDCMQSSQHVSDDDLLDDIIDELQKRNQADLFDPNGIYLNPESVSIIDVLCEDTRHQIQRVLSKAKNTPAKRLQKRLVPFYMWLDLAMKCRKSRTFEVEMSEGPDS
jgi:hypothetical protein